MDNAIDIQVGGTHYKGLQMQPIILITKIIAYMYNSLNFYIKITVMTIFIQMIASAVIKLLRRY